VSRHRLVALTGEKGSGKGVLARWLAREHGYQIDSFAAPLKRMCTHLMGWTAEQLADPVFKETVDPRFGFAPRWFMQHLATECIRKEFGQDVWSRALVERIGKKIGEADEVDFDENYAKPTWLSFVVDDLRFCNELEWISSSCSLPDVCVLTVRINRGGRPQTGDLHVSEQEIYKMDVDEELDVPWYFDQEGEAEGTGRTIGERDLIRDFETILKPYRFI
jgi:hypothetical protein